MTLTRRSCAVLLVAASPTLAGAGEVRGRVLVEDKPMGGIVVFVRPFEDPAAAAHRQARREDVSAPTASGTTRPDGTFAVPFTDIAGSAVRVGFSGAPVTPVVLDRLVDGPGEDVGDIRLVKALSLAGRVVDERGGPIVGATVTLWAGSGRGLRLRDAASIAEAQPQSVTTTVDGSFRFATAADEGNRLRVEAPAFATLERAGLRSGALVRPVTLLLGQLWRGTVTLPDRGRPAGGALVRFEGRTTTTRWTEARPDGSFLLDSAPREPGSLVADAGDRGRASLVVTPGSTEPVVLVLAPTAALSGRVVEAETARPLAGVRLLLSAENGGRFLARSGPDGRYAIRGLPPRRYRLAADDDRFVAWAHWLTVAAARAETQDVPLVRAAALSGRVVSEDGQPIEGALVQVVRSGENVLLALMRALEPAGVVRSGRDGSFRVTRLAPGADQRLEARHEEFEQRAIGGISLAPGTPRAGLVVVMRRGLSVHGTVRNEDERPIGGAEVTLSQALSLRSGRGGVQMSMIGPGSEVRRETGADGRFEFRGLKAGDYVVAARRSGFARAVVDPVKVVEGRGAEPVVLTLRPGVTISGIVRDRSGSGLPGWTVTARGAGGPALGLGGLRAEEPTGADGFFVLEGLATGEAYDLQALGAGGLGPRRAGVVAPAEGVELIASGTGQIRGRVADAESGRAVPDFTLRYQPDAQSGGVRLVMRGGTGSGRGPYTKLPFHAEDGGFVLEDVPAGRWLVEVFAPGYQAGSAANVAVNEGEATEGVEVRLAKGATVSGRVLDARSGRPILDAAVRAEQSGGPQRVSLRMGSESGENETTTDAEGRYEIAGLGPGSWAVTASHPDWTEATATVELKDAPGTADIRLGQGGSIGGGVLSAGRPVAGAQVRLSPSGDSGRMPSLLLGSEQGSISDESGRFRFDRLKPGRYSLVASLRDESSAPAETAVLGDDSHEVQLTLAAGALIRGQVSGLAEGRLGGVNVSANGPDYFANTRTAASGAFELSGVPEGLITVSASAGDMLTGSRSASTAVTIAPGQAEAAVEIVFAQGFRVDGHVTRGGRPIPDAMVMALPEGGSRRSATARCDETGSYVLEGLDEGRYNLTASAPSGGRISRAVTIAGDTTMDLEAPPARLAGTVVDADGGRPLADVGVRLEDQGEGVRFASMASTDSSGRFELPDLDPKRYRVSFQRPAYQTETRELTAAEDSDVRVELRRGEGLALDARDGIFGTPLRGLFVRLLDGSQNAVFAGSVSLDSEGRGELPAVKPGVYELRAQSSGYAVATLSGVTVPSRAVSLVLTPGGTLDIQAGPQTQAIPNATGVLLGAGGRPCIWNPLASDGKVRITGPLRTLENVPPGAYTFQVAGGVSREVTVTEGGRVKIVLP